MNDARRILPGLAKVLLRGSSQLSLDAFKAGTAVHGHCRDAVISYTSYTAAANNDQVNNDQVNNDQARTDTLRKSIQSVINPTPSFTSSAVPQSRISRASTYTSLAFSMLTSPSTRGDTLTKYLCRLRGGALKLGQMLSIQEDSLLPPEWVTALEQVRKAADIMPEKEVNGVLAKAYGNDYKDILATTGITASLDPPSPPFSPSSLLPLLPLTVISPAPLASASIGQVHKGELADGTWIALKLQYPGIQDAIDSDLENLQMLISYTNLIPKGVFINDIIAEGRKELGKETNYHNELKSQAKFHALVANDNELTSLGFRVPRVAPALSTADVLVTEFAFGYSIDKCTTLSQQERDNIARGVLRLTLLELFVWRFMQTDPNWGNFIYDPTTKTTSLIDFGGARSFDKDFVDGYREIVWAAANGDGDALMSKSIDMKFLTGTEHEIMLDAHRAAGMILGEPFASKEPYDFANSNITTRIGQQAKVFTAHRVQAPPMEVYTLHRKLAGAFLLAIKLRAKIDCRSLMKEVYEESKKS